MSEYVLWNRLEVGALVSCIFNVPESSLFSPSSSFSSTTFSPSLSSSSKEARRLRYVFSRLPARIAATPCRELPKEAPAEWWLHSVTVISIRSAPYEIMITDTNDRNYTRADHLHSTEKIITALQSSLQVTELIHATYVVVDSERINKREQQEQEQQQQQ